MIGWNYKAQLTIQSSMVGATLPDFPLLLTVDNLPAEMFDADGALPAQSGGGDIRFSSDSAGATLLPCEIVSFITNNDPAAGQAEIWVKVASVSHTANTLIYVWWNTEGSTNQPAADNEFGSEAVWSGYVLVSHGITTDSSGDYTLTASGTAQKTGRFGTSNGARGFGSTEGSGTADKVTTNLTAHNAQRTYQAWVYRTGAGGGNFGRIFEKRVSGSQVELWFRRVYVGDPDGMALVRAFSSAVGEWYDGDAATSEWASLALSFDSGSADNDAVMYLNGASQTVTERNTPSGTANTNTDAYVIGNRGNDNARNWDGRIAEFRIYNGLLAAAWITAEYENQTSPALFVLDGTPESSSGGETLSITIDPTTTTKSGVRIWG